MRLSKIASLLSCKLVLELDFDLFGVSINSREVKNQQLFIAIKGERFDGHDYILDAERAGAAAVITERPVEGLKIPQLIVDSSLEALATIARYHREHIDCKVIALTGSNGKTTVKEMISSILPKPFYSTPGNLNNHIGVPLCALELKPTDKYAVFELGANHIGEIANTVSVVKPSVALINNIAPAHIEGFGSIEGVARAKGEIYQGLSSTGVAIVNDDDKYAHFWDDIIKDNKVLRFSRTKTADISACDISFNEYDFASFNLVVEGITIPISLQVPGKHNISNALAAAACTYAAGISLASIASGLESFAGVDGRITFRKGKKESVIIDDTYNANLRSTLTAIDVLSARKGLRILVLGDMGELGDFTTLHHQEVGVAACESGIDLVLTWGDHSKHTAQSFGQDGVHYEDKDSLVDDLLSHLDESTTVLVKGSRSSAMEEIVQKLI
ncbi:MAG: UDP-N-acetylmuramoyl-tripeptide--D-alanyl-D-alanine ligase [Legionellaceae bacterium]|nr:UDP-N-acetylmuramoyl-tripeptide--D-alanyl-D-alanine ligase [Legionellaceae bacterium]